MDEQFDKDIVNHIRQVFDKHEDPSADAGWRQLCEKFPEEESRRRPIAWFWRGAAAALLFLGLGIGFLIYNNRVEPVKMARKKPVSAQSETLAKSKPKLATSDSVAKNEAEAKHPTIGKTNALASSGAAHLKNRPGLTPSNNIAPKEAGSAIAKNEILIKNRKPKPAARIFNDHYVTKTSFSKNVPVNPLIQTKQKLVIPLGFEPRTGATIPTTHSEQAIAENPPSVKGSSLPKTPAISGEAVDSTRNNNKTVQSLASITQQQVKNDSAAQKRSSTSISSMFAKEKQMDVAKNEEKMKTDRKVRFSIYAATYFNYAKGSDNEVNVGAGFTSDIPLTTHLKLVTGVTLAQNSLNFTGGVPVTAQQTALVAASAPRATAALYASSTFAPVAKPTFQGYNASLVGLDIPVNLKYEFSPQKNSAYISAGVSSGTFVDETYTYKYNYPAFFSPSVQQTQGTTAHNSFNNFYFAKTLNVAFGLGYPFGKNRLIVEPFLKYPLDGLGAQQLRFGAGGVNLKFNFQPPKK